MLLWSISLYPFYLNLNSHCSCTTRNLNVKINYTWSSITLGQGWFFSFGPCFSAEKLSWYCQHVRNENVCSFPSCHLSKRLHRRGGLSPLPFYDNRSPSSALCKNIDLKCSCFQVLRPGVSTYLYLLILDSLHTLFLYLIRNRGGIVYRYQLAVFCETLLNNTRPLPVTAWATFVGQVPCSFVCTRFPLTHSI